MAFDRGIQSQDLVGNTGTALAGVLEGGADANLANSLRTSAMNSWKEKRIADHGQAATQQKADIAEGVLEEKQAYTEGEQEKARGRLMDLTTPEGKAEASRLKLQGAQTKQAEAAARKSDRWTASGSGKTDASPSLYLVNGKPITVGQAKQAFKEFEDIDPETVAINKSNKAGEVAKYLDTKGMDSTSIWTSEADAKDFISLYEIDPAAAEKEDKKAYKIVDEALKGYKSYSGFQDFLDKKYSGTTDTTKAHAPKGDSLGIR